MMENDAHLLAKLQMVIEAADVAAAIRPDLEMQREIEQVKDAIADGRIRCYPSPGPRLDGDYR